MSNQQKVELYNFAQNQMHMYGLIEEGWQFVINPRPKSRLGACKYDKKVIEISEHWIGLETIEKMKDTILHEIAHALTQGDHHGARWKAKCLEIGANPARTHETDKTPEPKYVIVVDGEIVKPYYKKPSNKTWVGFEHGMYYISPHRGKPHKVMSYEQYKTAKVKRAK